MSIINKLVSDRIKSVDLCIDLIIQTKIQFEGQLVTNRTWNYKTPGAKDIPIDFRVKFIETENTSNRVGVLRSKTTGEPSLALGYVIVCALRHALDSVLKDNGQGDTFIPLGISLIILIYGTKSSENNILIKI